MDRVLPDYAGGSIVNLTASVLQAFDIFPPSAQCRCLPANCLRDNAGIVLFVCDGLGLSQLEAALHQRRTPNLSRWVTTAADGLQQLTSTFPSTTTAALASLNTARPPAEHGILGMYQWLDEVGAICNMLRFATASNKRAPFSEDLLFTVPTIYQLMAEANVPSFVISSRDFEGTALTNFLHRGAAYRGNFAISDLPSLLETSFAETDGQRSFHYVYWPMIDTIGHFFGPGSEAWLLELEIIDLLLGKLLQLCETSGYTLLFTADHGQTTLDPQHALRADLELGKHLCHLPGGSSRAMYLHTHDKAALLAAPFWEVDGLEAIDTVSAIAQGWFGGDLGRYQSRIGQVIALTGANRQLLFDYGNGLVNPHLGSHAALSAAEMRVPLLVQKNG